MESSVRGIAMIMLENVSYWWEDGEIALNNINLEVKEGQFVLISGRSGSGKSTLGSTINGLIPHYYNGKIRGKVYVDGKDISKIPLHEIGHLVGTVFQDPRSQFFTTTTDEEIAFGLQTICKTKEEIIKRVEKVYKDLGIEELKEKSVFELSSGQKQKIAIASIYAMKPKVLILDEPSANLDMKATFDLYRVLKKLKETGTTVILIEHRLYYAKPLFDRFILIKDGKIQRDISREETLTLPEEYWDENGLRLLELNKCKICQGSEVQKDNGIVLKGERLSFYYRKHSRHKQKEYILKDLDFKLHAGSSVGMIGLNGTGKTTFARIISGIEKVKEGKLLDGKDEFLRNKELMEASYFVFQDSDYQLFSESVLDEMLLGLPKCEKEESKDKAISILKDLELEKYIKKHPFALSRGEKQRLTIACGMMKNAKIFLYDEPTSGCDRKSMMAVSTLIKRQMNRGITSLIISHDFEFLTNTVSSVWVMEDANIKESIEMTEENKFFILEKMMGGVDFEQCKNN